MPSSTPIDAPSNGRRSPSVNPMTRPPARWCWPRAPIAAARWRRAPRHAGTGGGGWAPPPPAAGPNEKRRPDATRLRIKDATGRVIQTYVWPANDLAHQLEQVDLEQVEKSAGRAKPAAVESGDTIIATVGDLSLQISQTTGLLVSASRQGKSFSLVNGPRVVAMGPRLSPPPSRPQNPPAAPPTPPALAPGSKLTSLGQKTDGNDLVVS